MSKPILALIPSGHKGGSGLGTVYSILPNNGDGDFDYERNGNATRVRKDGLIEELTVDDTPRLDWYNSNCPSLLLEPQRVNRQFYSEQIDNAVWTKINITVTSNDLVAPNGEYTADKVQRTSTSASYVTDSASKSSASQLDVTTSMFVKKGEGDFFAIRQQGVYPNRGEVKYQFSTNTLTTSVAGSDFTAISSSAEDYGNGWIRISATFNTDASSTVSTLFSPRATDGTVDASDTSDSAYAYVWGVQVEEGSYPTSYIKTENGTSTRFVDNCHLLNQTLFTDYPFTVYAKAKVEAIDNVVFSLIDSTVSNKYLSFYFASSTQVGILRRDASNNDSDFYNFTYSVGDTIKVAVAFISDTAYKLYVNGTELADVTSGLSIPFDHNDITLGQQRIVSDSGTRNSIDDFRVFDYTLTDAELTELTT